MKRGLLAIGVAATLGSPLLQIRESAFFRIDLVDGAYVAGAGVCAISPESVVCWDMTGKSDTGLEDEVRAYLGDPNRFLRLPINQGSTTRFLVVKALSKSYEVQVRSYSGPNYILGPSVKPELRILPCVVDKWVKEGHVDVSIIDMDRSPSLKLPSRKGASGTLNGRELEIGEIKKSVGWHEYPMPGDNVWAMVFGGEDSPRGYELRLEAEMRDGTIIRAVDADGRPVRQVEYERWLEKAKRDPRNTNSYYWPAQLGVGLSRLPSAFVVYSNVDPRHIHRLRIVDARLRRVKLIGFPLAPR